MLMGRLTRELKKNNTYIKCYGISAVEKNKTTYGKWGNTLLNRVAKKGSYTEDGSLESRGGHVCI